MKIYFVILIAGLFLTNCKKYDSGGSPPLITIQSPKNHQVFQAGQTVNITGTITDSDEIVLVHLYVYNIATNLEILHAEEHPGNKSFNLAKSFVVESGITYKIRVDAVDYAGYQSQSLVEVLGN